MSDERESGGGAGALVVVVLVVLLGGGLLAVVAVGGLFMFAVRSSHQEAQMVETRMHAEEARAMAEVARAEMEAAVTPSLTNPSLEFIVSINAAGEYSVAGEKKTADELELVLLQFARDNPNSSLAVRADKDAPLDSTVKLLEACKRVGVTNFQLTTESAP